jgi:Carboxypeptidase regulatory-like domain
VSKSRSATIVALLVAAVALSSACAFVPAAAPVSPVSADGMVRFTGAIISLAGGQIAGARLTVLNGVNKDAQATTDAAGHYAFPSLQSGTFNVLIAANGFTSITPQIDLFQNLDANFALSTAR